MSFCQTADCPCAGPAVGKCSCTGVQVRSNEALAGTCAFNFKNNTFRLHKRMNFSCAFFRNVKSKFIAERCYILFSFINNRLKNIRTHCMPFLFLQFLQVFCPSRGQKVPCHSLLSSNALFRTDTKLLLRLSPQRNGWFCGLFH